MSFSGCTVLLASIAKKLGSSDQEASPSTSKNSRAVLEPCHAWLCAPRTISGGADIPNNPWVSFVSKINAKSLKDKCITLSQPTF